MSTNRRIYLDFNATSPLILEAREAITAAMSDLGNPSSIHAEGRRARDHIERARDRVARLAGQPREHVVFTSGGTEANRLGIELLATAIEERGLPRVVATTALEHPSLSGAVWALRSRGWRIQLLPVDPEGVIQVAAGEGVGLLAISAVNHELGTMPDLAALVARARAMGARVHVDAVQGAGRILLAPITTLADAVAISAHKLGGPQGVGAVIVADPDLAPTIPDGQDPGHQERGRRPGTENTLGIIGFGAAADVADPTTWPAVAELGARLEVGLLAIPGTRIHGTGAPRVGGTINAGFAGARGESIVVALDLAGVAASTGAACTSGSVTPSTVLRGLGQSPEQAREAVRFSLGRSTTADEIGAVLDLLPAIVERARRHRG